jgi:DNA-binding transcriptional regulator YhcF (GntR family)
VSLVHRGGVIKISIDLDDPRPPVAQLVEQLRGAVNSGHLQPGDSLPSIRQLAGDLALNEKTVAKAYRLLERTAVIQTKGYRGSFVHPDAVANSKVDLSEWTQEKMGELVTELVAAGVSDAEIRKAFQRAMNGDKENGNESDAAVLRRIR